MPRARIASTRTRQRRYAGTALAGGLLVAAALAGCSSGESGSIASQANNGQDQNYVSGDGAIQVVTAAARKGPVTLSGTTLSGKPWSLKDAAGKVVVVNAWGSWCPPCVGETPQLEKAYRTLRKAGAPVLFIGINEQESPATAQAFLTSRKVTYPSLRWDGGAPLLGLQGKANATPTTLILDSKGRIAARVNGPVTSATTLVDLVQDVVASGERS